MATTGYAAAIDSNDLIMSYIAESAWSVTPSNPAFQKIRLDSEGFSGSKSRTRPNEIDPSGQASAAITTKEESTGSLNFSVSAGLTSNPLLASSLGGVWTTPVNMSGTTFAITVASAVDASSVRTCTLTDSGAGFVAAGVIVGQFLKVCANGASAAVGSFIGRVKTVAAGTLTFDCVSNLSIAVATAPQMGTVTIKGSCLRNGTTFQSFTFEKKLSAALFLRYAGAFPTGGSLDVGVGDYLKGTMAFLNKAEESATTAIAGASYLPATTSTVIDSVKGIGTVWRGTDVGATSGPVTPIEGVVQKLGVKWNKEGAAAQYGIGSAAALGMRPGKMLVTGTISTYFAGFALYDQYLNEETGPISFYAIDGAPDAASTKGYVITFTNATIMNPKVVAGGPGQDVMADFEIEGNPDISSPSLFAGKTIQIDYFD